MHKLKYILILFLKSCFPLAISNILSSMVLKSLSVDDLILCDDLSNDGIEEFDLEQQTIDILGGQSATDYVVTYYTTFETAEAGTDNLVSPYLSTSDEQEIYVRVQSAGGGGCFIVSPTPLFNLIVNNKATATAPIDLTRKTHKIF